uniref:Flavin-containing monooxygenase n=1 Tax=Helianthus annuus TaxID=4232 RepID=A0A251TRB9_HELAN
MARSLKVAVIGAGVAGLAAARELQRESLQVVVFEKSHQLGGTWAYDARVESDLLGVDPNRDVVHSSAYKSLKTNVPRVLMSFTDFKFGEKVYGDPRMYPGHVEVLKFLTDFASHFELTELIRFNTLVTRVEVDDSDITEFVVESNTNGVISVEVFDAVVVCNGHNTQPRLATDIPGIKTWSRKQMHSHNYRVPEPFRDQVIVIGSGPSAVDISRDIATVAKEVHMSSRSPLVKVAKSDKFNNMWQHSKIEYISKDGLITFQDGFSIDADIILHCTGKIESQDPSSKNLDGIISERESFELCGPSHLTNIDWTNPDHRRSVAACLVQGVCILERDRQENRQASEALAPPWWNFFQFDLHSQLIDDAYSCIFGAIYKSKHPPSQHTPSYVIAFRGTLIKGNAFSRDLELDIHIIKNGLHLTSRFDIAMQAVRNLVGSQTSKSNIWLTGHSLGSAMALLAGNEWRKPGSFLIRIFSTRRFFPHRLKTLKTRISNMGSGSRAVFSLRDLRLMRRSRMRISKEATRWKIRFLRWPGGPRVCL